MVKHAKSFPVFIGTIAHDQDFSKGFKFRKIGKPILINEQYAMLHGKRSKCGNSANEMVINFENAGRARLFNQYR